MANATSGTRHRDPEEDSAPGQGKDQLAADAGPESEPSQRRGRRRPLQTQGPLQTSMNWKAQGKFTPIRNQYSGNGQCGEFGRHERGSAPGQEDTVPGQVA
jgi:hypothetical protein